MTKLALIHIYDLLDWECARIVLTVHDEIVCESTDEYAPHCAQVMKTGMERAAQEVLNHLGGLVIIEPAISNKYDK